MATTYDKASLVMIPSGVKEDKLYSVKPTDGSGDFTFSRGTDTATRVNSSGLIEKERGNLLPYSNTFSTNWTKARVTLTSGQSGYDGSSDAWSVVPTADNNTHAFFYNITGALVPSGVHTFSVYAKANGYSYIVLRDSATTEGKAKFDLSTGVTESTGAIASKITSVGSDGWYRCEVTTNRTSGGGNNFLIYTQESYTYDVGYVGNTTSGVLIQDAQINQGLVAQPYIETTTAAVYEGITDNLPRLDYSGGASCPSLLLEPSRTNDIGQSEYFNAWDEIGGASGSIAPVITVNFAQSPEGVQNAARIQFDKGSGTTDLYYSLIRWQSMSSAVRSYSIYMRSTDGISTYNVALRSDNHESFEVTGEWQRFDITSNTAQTYIQIGLRGTWGTSDTADILVYGAQGEQGSYPTSYIPTYGTSASRADDDLNSVDFDANGISTNPNAWTLIIKGNWSANGALVGNNHSIGRNEGGTFYRYSNSVGFTSSSKGYWTEYSPSAPTAYIWDGVNFRLRRGGSDIRTISASSIGWNSGGITNWTLNNVSLRLMRMDLEQILVFNSVLTDSEIDQLTA